MNKTFKSFIATDNQQKTNETKEEYSQKVKECLKNNADRLKKEGWIGVK